MCAISWFKSWHAFKVAISAGGPSAAMGLNGSLANKAARSGVRSSNAYRLASEGSRAATASAFSSKWVANCAALMQACASHSASNARAQVIKAWVLVLA